MSQPQGVQQKKSGGGRKERTRRVKGGERIEIQRSSHEWTILFSIFLWNCMWKFELLFFSDLSIFLLLVLLDDKHMGHKVAANRMTVNSAAPLCTPAEIDAASPLATYKCHDEDRVYISESVLALSEELFARRAIRLWQSHCYSCKRTIRNVFEQPFWQPWLSGQPFAAAN